MQDRETLTSVLLFQRILASLLLAVISLGGLLVQFGTVKAAGNLTVEIIAAYNLVVDSNVTSPSTYAPSVATVIGKFCNSGDTELTDVQGYIGDFTNATPGIYPSRDSATFDPAHPLYNTGTYAFTHVGGRVGTADATRYIDTLAAGECKVQYWHFRYPQCSNSEDPPCSGTPVWGNSVKPDDDLWLQFDIWGTSAEGSTANATWTMTMRNEISAMANKIEPNPNGQWFNTDSNTVRPGELITSNGILYNLGNINQGFDNDGDFVYDYNAWLQPIGDPSYDPSCYRLIRTTGVLTVSRSAGKPDMLIPFEDQLYFTNLPPDNTGAIGEVHYTFLALNGPCSTSLTPYQEVASGSDNEKFNGDYGSGIPPVGSSEPEVTLDKSSSPSVVSLGSTITYQIPFENTGATAAGLPLYNMPLVISDTIPSGTNYVAGSAAADVSVSILYSTDNGATWSTTEPSPASDVTTIQWQLTDPLAAGVSGTATFQAQVPSGYSGSAFIENTACASFGSATCFAEASTTTLVSGSNSVGDFVWQDEDGDGVQDGGEAGIDNVTVSLYRDQNGDGRLDSDDILIATTATAGGGSYSFANLPNGNYLVQVDDSDADLPSGCSATTAETYAVTDLGITITSPYNNADFGFGPVLQIEKQLTTSDPVSEGDTVTYTIDLTNNRPGDGTGQANSCTYAVWATSEASQSSTQNNNKRFSNSTTTFEPPTNAFGQSGPDELYANGDYSTGGNQIIAGTSYNIGNQAGSIVTVEALFQIFLDATLTDDSGTGTLFFNGTQQGTTRSFTTADLNAFTPASNVGLLTWDVTSVRTWDWSDFTGDLDLQYGNSKSGSADAGRIFVDAMGFRITTDTSCGGADDTIATLPVTDTYNADLLQFISASLTQTGATTGGGSPYANTGTITWDDVGPLHAGQTRTITVTFTALEPPDNDSDGENDTATLPNAAESKGATFANGNPVNDASDSVSSTLNPAGSIGDTVWNDNGAGGGTSGDGVQNGGEQGIANVMVYLCTTTPCNSGSATATDVTDAGGNYLFEGLPDGTYYAGVDTGSLPGSSFTQTGDPDEAGTCATCDSEGSATLNNNDGNSANDDDLTLDFGYTIPNTVYGSVWEDNDGDGSQASGEDGIGSATVNLDNCGADAICGNGDDGATDSTTTYASGNYVFSDLPDGNYRVRVDATTLPAGGTWNPTADPEGDNNDQTDVIAVAGGNVYGAYDFGYNQTDSSIIGDTLYTDWGGDGTQNSGEEGIANVTISLYEDSDGDGIVDSGTDGLIATDVTDANGNYSFSNLPAGDYIIVVDETDADLPSTYVQTEDPDEAGVCSTCNGRSSVTGVDGTSSYNNEDFGYQPTGFSSIGDFVWNDADSDGIQDSGESGIANINVSLYEDSNNDGAIDSGDALITTTTTDASGNYSFSNLPAGNYLVDVDTTDGDLPTDGNSNRYVLSTDNDPHDVTLGTAQDYTTADFGFTAGGTIGDFIWQDNDGDGGPDPGEPGVANVTVTLYNDVNGNGAFDSGTDTVYGTDATDADGLYEFVSLPAGDYVVVVDTTDADLPSSTVTGDPDENGTCTTCDGESGVTLTAGQVDRSRDFGFGAPGVIGDTLWIDSDGNGVQDAGESGVRYVTVTLYDCGADANCGNGDDQQVASTTTDSDGRYAFGDVADGSYNVHVDTADTDFPSGLTQTYDPDESNPCTTCNSIGLVTITSGGSDLTVDFGYYYNGPYSISGTVFHDAGGDGGLYTPGNGDTPYANVTVYLWNSNNQLIATTTTDTHGDYAFGNLPNGDYTVSVNQNAPNLTGTNLTSPTPNALRAVTISGASVTDQDFGFVSQVDMGDLPNSYADTTLDDDGARHKVDSLYLGSSTPDKDADGQESVTANGDDTDSGGNDDDGVVPTTGVDWNVGADGGSVDVTVGGCDATCYVSAWIDWNDDGDLVGTGERILLDRAVANGTQTITFDIPAGASLETNNARFRLYQSSTDGWAQPTGLVSNGEVEDYQWQSSPTAVRLGAIGLHSPADSFDLALPLMLLVGLGVGLLVMIRSRLRLSNAKVSSKTARRGADTAAYTRSSARVLRCSRTEANTSRSKSNASITRSSASE